MFGVFFGVCFFLGLVFGFFVMVALDLVVGVFFWGFLVGLDLALWRLQKT